MKGWPIRASIEDGIRPEVVVFSSLPSEQNKRCWNSS